MLKTILTKTIKCPVAVSSSKFGISVFSSKSLRLFARNITALSDKIHAEASANGELKTMDSLPGPKLYPLIGNLKHFQNGLNKLHITQLEETRKYGPIYRDSLFGTTMVMVKDPEVSKEVYRAEGKFPIRDFSFGLRVFFEERAKMELPKSIIDQNGEEWAQLRRKFHKKMLVPGNIKAFYPLFSDIAIEAVNLLRSMRDENSVVENVRDGVLGKWALESIGKFIYGTRTGLLDAKLTGESKRFYEGISVVLTNSMFLSKTKWLKYIYRSKYKEFKDGFAAWYGIGFNRTKSLMEHVKKASEAGQDLDENMANSLICYLMLAKNMDMKECTTHAVEFYGAGYDTTSITTSWLLYWLGMNLDKQEILYNEIMEKMPADGRITDASVQRMPYLRACIKESARLTPLATANMRTFDKDMVLCGYIIPANTKIMLSNYAMGRDENLYPNADSFIPERWLRANKTNEEIHPFSSLPFGFGARSCLGRRVAEAEMQVFIAQLVKRCKIKYMDKEQEGEILLGLTLSSNKFAFYDR